MNLIQNLQCLEKKHGILMSDLLLIKIHLLENYMEISLDLKQFVQGKRKEKDLIL